MITVAQYRQFAAECRELAEKLTDEDDKRAVALMAASWDKVAAERETLIKAADGGFFINAVRASIAQPQLPSDEQKPPVPDPPQLFKRLP